MPKIKVVERCPRSPHHSAPGHIEPLHDEKADGLRMGTGRTSAEDSPVRPQACREVLEGTDGGCCLRLNCINSLDRTGTDQQETQAFDVSDGLDAQKERRGQRHVCAETARTCGGLLRDLSCPARRGPPATTGLARLS